MNLITIILFCCVCVCFFFKFVIAVYMYVCVQMYTTTLMSISQINTGRSLDTFA